MTRYNFREASLLDSSGELGSAARRHLIDYLRKNPDARLEYQEIREGFSLLNALPAIPLSSAERRRIPAEIKAAIATIQQQEQLEKRAAKRRTLIRYALGGIASAAAMMLLMASVSFHSAPRGTAAHAPDADPLARLNATVDRLAGLADQHATPYEQAVTDVEASIRQLQTESPTLAEVQDKDIDNLLDVLATVPSNKDDFPTGEAAGPPGSL